MPDPGPERPLTVFERYMLADHRPGYPMHAQMQLQLEGPVDPERLAASLGATMARHPLLRSRLGRGGWIEDPTWTPSIHWCLPDEPDFDPDPTPIDLGRGPDIGIRCRRTGAGWTMTLRCHHATSDGLGGIAFATDLLLAYEAAVLGEAEPRWVRSAPDRLALRGQLGRPAPREPRPDQAAGRRSSVGRMLREAWNWLTQVPTRLPGDHPPQPPGPALAPPKVRILPAPLGHGLGEAARRSGATLNDLLLAEHLAAVAEWCRERGGTDPSAWLIALVPTNQRTLKDRYLPAANKVGYNFVSRRLADSLEVERNLPTLVHEMREVQELALGAMLFDLIGPGFLVPGLVELVLAWSRGFATTVFTNMGRVEATLAARTARGGPVLEPIGGRLLRVVGVAPIRPGTRLGISLTQRGDEITLGASFDRTVLGDRLQDELLDRFVDRLARRAATC